MKLLRGIIGLLGVFIFCTATYASGENYPEKVVNMIIPFSAGGSSDVQARVMEKYWNKYAPVKWNFIYKPGAGGILGFSDVFRAKPDGYTIGNVNVPHIIIQPLAGHAQFSPEKFTYLCQVVNDPACLVVRADSPIQSVQDLFEQVRSNPKRIKGGLVGPLSGHHLIHLDMSSHFDFPATPIFYKGGADQVAALLGGEVDFIYASLAEMLRIREEVRILGLAAEQRSPLVPDVPTFRELGYNITSGQIRRGYFAPVGILPERVEWIRDIFRKICTDSDYLADMKRLGFPAEYLDGPDFERLIEGQKQNIAEAFNL